MFSSKYKLHIPTPEETFNVILYSSSLYWRSKSLEAKIYSYISKLSDLERCAVVYINDFYQLKELNNDFVYGFIKALSSRVTGYYYDEDYSELENSQEFVVNLVNHICAEDIKGTKVDYKKLRKSKTLDAMVSTAKNINVILNSTEDLIKTFYGTDTMPIDIAHMKDVLRKAIVLSDTDSTCATYNDYVKWFFGADLQTPEAVSVAAVVMTINAQVVDHYLKVLTANMNVEKKLRDILAMKNEFYWKTMVPANVSKHYYAGVFIQEGVVFKELDRELKGVNFIAGNIPKYFKEHSLKLIDDIQDTLNRNEKLDLYSYVNRVATLEKEILSTLKSLRPDTLKTGKIKEGNAYLQSDEESAYRYHTLWNEVFSEKYGHVDEPPYSVYELPILLKNKTMTKKLLDNENEEGYEIRKKLHSFIDKYFSSGLMTIKIPKSKVDTFGIPKELEEFIDYKRSVEIIMNVFYMTLDTIGFYRKPGLLVCEHYDM